MIKGFSLSSPASLPNTISEVLNPKIVTLITPVAGYTVLGLTMWAYRLP